METYWCCKNNSIIDNYLKPDFNYALVPCIKEASNKELQKGYYWRRIKEDPDNPSQLNP